MRKLTILAAACGATVALAQPAFIAAQQDETAVPIRGTVVSVNRNTTTVVLRFIPPGSQPATKREFELSNHNDVLRLHPGQVIDGTVNETHKTWVLSDLNIETNRPPHGDVGQ